MKFYCITRFVQCFSPSVDQILRYSILTTKITRLNTCFCIVPLTWESFIQYNAPLTIYGLFNKGALRGTPPWVDEIVRYMKNGDM